MSPPNEYAMEDWFSKENSTSKQTISDNEIIANVLKSELSDSDTESDYEEEKVTFSHGIELGDQYLKFLEKQSVVTQQEIMTVYRLQQKLRREKFKVLKQPTIVSAFANVKDKCRKESNK